MPKSLAGNLLWRKELRTRAADDPAVAKSLLTACAQSPLFWINAFVWTYRQKMATEDGSEKIITGEVANVPFITWPVQDDAVYAVQQAIADGEDINIEKSRDMGATWLLMALIDWYFLFKKNVNIGVVSRKEILVDNKGDMDSLFEKVRYINRMLPAWMMPANHGRYMYMRNAEMGSTITGESTNANVGRGGRKTFYFVDEAAAIPNATEIENSLSQNTVCQIWVSTPMGPNTCFHQRIKEHRGAHLQLPWYRHPEKSMGAQQVRDSLGKIKWTSPWYRKQESKYSSKTIAQEIDMDHGQAGDIFFDYQEIERHRQDYQAAPEQVGDVIWLEDMSEKERIDHLRRMDYDAMSFIPGARRTPWRLWMQLDDGRPPQSQAYVFGIDISNGSGNSNSVITVVSRESGRVVAKWWDAFTSPEELAVVAASAGIWFGGLNNPPLIVWENNGPGGIFGRKLVKMSYPSYYRQRPEGTRRDKRGAKWGWNSNAASKEVLLGRYRDALAKNDIINPCQESLDEAIDYIYTPDGALIPSRLREETGGGRQLHGDHVIADALTVLGLDEMPAQKKSRARPPQGSFEHRRNMSKRRTHGNEWKD